MSGSYKDLKLPLRRDAPSDSEELSFVGPPRKYEQLYHRDSYYVMSIAAQSVNITIAAGGLLTSSWDDKISIAFFLVVEFFSVPALALVVFLHLRNHSYTALFHYSMSVYASIIPSMAIVFFSLVSISGFPALDDFRFLSAVYVISFWIFSISFTSCSASITKGAAIRARGTESVQVDSSRTVAAWTLTSASESESL